MNKNVHNLKLKTESLLNKLKELKITTQDLFLNQLVFIDQEGILPGALLPRCTQFLVFENRQITPILPLNPILLDYFTPEELTKQLKFELIDEDDLSQVTLILDLPNIKIPLFKDYTLQAENIIYEVPVLEVWPNFQAEGWTEYYGFYYDAEYGEETFQVAFPNVEEIQNLKDRKGSYQIIRCHEFPKFIECKNSQENIIGIILLPTPQKIELAYCWTIGIDFRNDYTSVYVNKDDKIVEYFKLDNLNYKVTYVLVETRFPVLFEYFIPESFIPVDKPFPMPTVLTTRGSTEINQERPIFDGRVYIPDRRYSLQETWVKKDLQWSNENLRYIRLFLKHLTLHLTANAVNKQVKTIQWCISYPPNFSREDKYEYAQMWKDITQELQNKTGVKHLCPNINDGQHFRSQSLAFAQYFTEYEDYDLVNTTCIDIGNAVSNISVWQDNQLVHQCSLNFGKIDIFSQFLRINPQILKIFDLEPNNWIELPEYPFYDKLDTWLRLNSVTWLSRKRELFINHPEFQQLITLMSIGLSGLYFYIGQILAVLYQEGKYTLKEITPVYIGGIGSSILNWLSEGGKFDRYSEINSLLGRMMSIGSGFSDTEEITRMSQNPQDEVACGLVLQDKKLQELDITVNNIDKYKITNFIPTQLFINRFHYSLNVLKIEVIKPIEVYKFKKEGLNISNFEYNQKLLQAISRDLQNYLNFIKADVKYIQQEPLFILELKALLRVLCKEINNK
ncbi:hypothetical protein B6N60_03427 [Richelia sinica FACHB-800]|uniref:Uncharacterized protein n=1 Tax=Richelia sinica FACHB-800 TaxID=1357546 RepID=A0A975Y5Z0_9NOST|nr:hypothetical protein [Richelia sinica]MBD2663531.1 hypothetical protein [Richelia sinica FACHB-800]QXE24719.1 hypothetical protein B6N60_03427 [Richelia sinica FACHB-800]